MHSAITVAMTNPQSCVSHDPGSDLTQLTRKTRKKQAFECDPNGMQNPAVLSIPANLIVV